MKNLIYFIIFLFPSAVLLGQCPEITGEDLISVDQVFRLKDLPYSANNSANNQMLDLYIPAPFSDCDEAKLIVVIHGGGFEGGSKNQLKGWGYYFAKKGYHVAVINYRLHMSAHAEFEEYMLSPFLFIGGNQCEKLNEISFIDGLYKIDKAWYFAIQDSRAALAYIQYELKERGKRIDKMYLVGESAGAISALGLALGDQKDFNAYNPLLEEFYGSIDSKVQYESPNPKSIDAVISISGGILNPEYFLSERDGMPLIFFHGGNDHVVSLCEDNCFYSERRLSGPLRLSELADSLNLSIPIKMHLWAGVGHNMQSKYSKISEVIMSELNDLPSSEAYQNKLNLYPKYALLYNCAVAALRDDIMSINHFISDDYAVTGISVYPNPSDGTFTLIVPNLFGHNISVRMYDALGRLTLEKNIPFVSKSEIVIRAAHINSGIYELLIIEDGKEPEKLRILLN